MARITDFCDRFNAAHPWDHNAHYHRWIMRALPAAPRRVLDAGCGTGALTRLLATRSVEVLGVDSDHRALARAGELAGAVASPRYQRGDLLELPLEGGFDAITCVATLHHLGTPGTGEAAALRRFRQLLAPGGTLVVLGVYREHGLVDRLVSLAAVPLNLLFGWWKHRRTRAATGSTVDSTVDSTKAPAYRVVTAPARTELRRIRALAAVELPGARIRRRLFWRYSLVFREGRASR